MSYHVPVDSPFDTGALANLERIGGEDLVARITRSFLDNVPAKVPAMEEALARGDLEYLSREAHSVKSSAGNIGAEALRLASEKLEESASRSGSDSAARKAFEGFKAEMERAVLFLKGDAQ